MTKRSPLYLIFRMFSFFIAGSHLISLFWNTLSGTSMFPFKVVVGTSVLLTMIVTAVGWITVTLGSHVLLGNDPEFKAWKAAGGRPYWDTLGWPINTATPIERQSGQEEPQYTDFVPPEHWRFQCPVCGARVEKQIDVCLACGYGHDGSSDAYYERWGNSDNT